jgi:hypothetical protein
VWEANADIIKGLKWVSTLDSRVCNLCASRDGKVYEISKAPPAPAHFGPCRCRKIPFLGEFKTKGTRASKGGPVPDNTTYSDWLRGQPNEVQDEVLGVTKAKLFRDGNLPLDRFVDPTGREYTLAELKRRDSAIYSKVIGD